MGLVLNLFRCRFERPDVILPYLSYPKERKAKEVFSALYDPRSATRIAYRNGAPRIVFLQGQAPEGIKTGTELYEWTAFPTLAKAVIEHSLADSLALKRFDIDTEACDDRPWGFIAFRPLPKQTAQHYLIEEGISFRATELDRFGDFALAIEWRSRTRFISTLADVVMQRIAIGSSVMLLHGTNHADLIPFEGEYLGRVSAVDDTSAVVNCKDGVERQVPSKFLILESSPKNLARFYQQFPKLSPQGGLMSAMLRADKSLSGNMRNRRIFRDRLDAVISTLGPNGEKTLEIPSCVAGDPPIRLSLEPLQLKPCTAVSHLGHLTLSQPQFVYRDNRTTKTNKKIDGLINPGPFKPLPNDKPQFGFIFPESYRDDARKLFLALRDGIGLFRGFPNWFRVPFRTEQVSHISGFEIPQSASNDEAGQIYKRALDQWLSGRTKPPELFFVIHDRTEAYEEATPYHVCKTRLLEAGIMTQNVTVDLIRNQGQFEWAAANIALAGFAKLGGTPWTLNPCSNRTSLIIGIGRSEKHDSTSRTRKRYQAFATCISSKGHFGFSSVSPSVDTEEELPAKLAEAAVASLKEAEEMKIEFDSLVVHLTGDLKLDDRKAIERAVESYTPRRVPIVCVLSVSDCADIFAVTDDNELGMPSRGTCVCLSERHFLLFTEGMEDLRSASRRMPCSVQVRLRHVPEGVDPLSLVAQVYDLSQVNFRGINGASKPVSVLYSQLIARILRHENVISALQKHPHLRDRMWFL